VFIFGRLPYMSQPGTLPDDYSFAGYTADGVADRDYVDHRL
jgi:hypothetical protein